MSVVAQTFPSCSALPPCDLRLANLHRYWLSIHPGPYTLPGRQHFDPIAVPKLLPWIWLADVHRNPLRFKYRLVGTVHGEAGGRDLTGQWLDEGHPGFAMSSACSHFTSAADAHEIGYYRGPPDYVIKKDYVLIERLILPLARNGKDVDILLGITVLYPGPFLGAARL